MFQVQNVPPSHFRTEVLNSDFDLKMIQMYKFTVQILTSNYNFESTVSGGI